MIATVLKTLWKISVLVQFHKKKKKKEQIESLFCLVGASNSAKLWQVKIFVFLLQSCHFIGTYMILIKKLTDCIILSLEFVVS